MKPTQIAIWQRNDHNTQPASPRQRGQRAWGWLAVIAALCWPPAMGQAQPLPELLFTWSTLDNQILFIDHEANTQVANVAVMDALPDFCSDDEDGRCYTIGAWRTTVDDHDNVVIAVTKADLTSVVASIPLSDTTMTTWRLDQVEFGDLTHAPYCPKTCSDTGPVPDTCRLNQIHEIQVVEENHQEQWVEVILTDQIKRRYVQVRLDYAGGNTCGQAQWVIDETDPGWPSTQSLPEGVQLLDEPEGRFLLTTFHTLDLVEQLSGGGIMLWDLTGTNPQALWTFPDPNASLSGTLNTPHGGRVGFDSVTGEWYLMYGHSFGDGRVYGVAKGGMWGLARLDDLRAQPDYLGEFQLPRGMDRLNFPRELELLPDGTFLGSDSGCYLGVNDAECLSGTYWFRPERLPFSDKEGSFSSDHADQNIVKLQAADVFNEVTCGVRSNFGPDVVPPGAYGVELRAAAARGGWACPE